MRALVYHGPGNKAWEEVPTPELAADTDAIVRVDAVTICGTDLHILKGDVPAVTDGRILGHEAVGTVESVGSGVKNVKPGDRVLVSCITACGSCRYCRAGQYGQCLGGGLEFACAGNFLFGAPDAQFGQPEMKLAVFAPAASCLLPLRIGQSRAEDLLFSGRSIDAQIALVWGFVVELADDPAVAALAYFDAHLAGKSASSLGFALRAARAPLIEQLRNRLAQVEALYLDGLMNTRDAVEGLQAFLDKRTPKWEHK